MGKFIEGLIGEDGIIDEKKVQRSYSFVILNEDLKLTLAIYDKTKIKPNTINLNYIEKILERDNFHNRFCRFYYECL